MIRQVQAIYTCTGLSGRGSTVIMSLCAEVYIVYC